MGSGMNAPVRSLSTGSDGGVYAGGVFTRAGGVDADRIAYWDGSEWHALGSGLNNIAWAMQFDESGNLYVGGGFNQAGGSPANHIARWDGTSWYAVGGGVDNVVRGWRWMATGGFPGRRFHNSWSLALQLYRSLMGPTGCLWAAAWMPRALAPNDLGDLYVRHFPPQGSVSITSPGGTALTILLLPLTTAIPPQKMSCL
jgi:hypothetical protein